MDNLLPDIYQKSIYTINYLKLKNSGIKCLIFGLNNTIAPLKISVPTKRMKELFEDLKEMGFKIIIVSNSKKSRVEPFKNILNVDASYHAHKPFKRKYKKILNLYNFKVEEVACIGDEIMTDILGANKMGMTSILVNPISSIDSKSSKFFRLFEILALNNFFKEEKLIKGEYYE